jgi:hypothetical protein
MEVEMQKNFKQQLYRANLEELELDLDQVINNIQVKLIEPIQHVVSIVEPKQLIVVATQSS